MTLIAPNLQSLIARVITQHPEINTRDENQRGKVLDYAAYEANRGTVGPWGRKSRNAQGTDLNSDAFCYSRPDGLFEIYDVISGGDGSATWEGYGPFKQGENGYWVPALPVSSAPPPVPAPAPPSPPPAAPGVTHAELNAAIASLRSELLARIPSAPPPFDPQTLRPAIEAVLTGYEVKGNSRTAFGHQHLVQLELKRK